MGNRALQSVLRMEVFVPVGPGIGAQASPYFNAPAGWLATNATLSQPGNVGEYQVGGVRADNGALVVVPQFLDAAGMNVNVKLGQKLY